MKNKSWMYYGNGLDSFGDNGCWKERELPEIKEDEILARVDAVAICASDVKMIRMGNRYPLFKDRDFTAHPAILGHELSLTVIQVGEHLKKDWSVGQRIGVQPDVYMDSVRYCMGVNVEGGFQQYIILGESVFHSDNGVTVFPVPDSCSYASIALLEPNACIEAAYRKFTRTAFSADKNLLIYISADAVGPYDLDLDLTHRKSILVNLSSMNLQKLPLCQNVPDLSTAIQESGSVLEDVLILGNPETSVLSQIIDALDNDAVFCWLPEISTEYRVLCDIAKIHYSKIFFTGAPSHRLSDAFKEHSFSLKKHGSFLIVGGAGAMGRMHVLRAVMDPDGPRKITVLATRHDRLQSLGKAFSQIAKEQGKELCLVAMETSCWEQQVHDIAPDGYDDVLICAPGTEPVDEGIPFLKKGGKLILFSGTSYGNRTWLPLGDMASCHTAIHASSGSDVHDEKMVLERMIQGRLNPNLNVMAIAGLNDVKKALEACYEGIYPGKIIIYPALEDLPLTGMNELSSLSAELADHVQIHGWDLTAEQYLLNQKEV